MRANRYLTQDSDEQRNKKKPEMTEEKFAEKYCNLGPELTENMHVIMTNNKEQLLADLRSVIRGKLIEYDKWLIKREGFSGEDVPSVALINEFLKDNQ